MSLGEERLVKYLRFCDAVIIWSFGASAISMFGFHSVRVLGLALGFVTFGSVIKLGGVIVAYVVMSSRTSNAEIAPWIRQWTRAACVITGLAAVYAIVAAPDLVIRLLALVGFVVCVRLFRRVGPLAIGEKGTGWGHSHATGVMFFPGFLGPELDAWLTAGWLVIAIGVRVSMPSLFRPSEQKVHADQLKMRVLAVVNAQNRYHREHGSYSSDVVALRRIGSSLIDSLVVVTADDKSYRVIARDPGGQASCGYWTVTRMGERTSLEIEGVGAGQLVCWTPADTVNKAR